MVDIYSPALLVALIAGAFALLAAGTSRWSAAGGQAPRISGWSRWIAPAAVLSTAALLLALGSHLLFGHRPGSERALAPFAFVAAHPATAVAGVMVVVAWMLHRGDRAGRSRGDRRSEARSREGSEVEEP